MMTLRAAACVAVIAASIAFINAKASNTIQDEGLDDHGFEADSSLLSLDEEQDHEEYLRRLRKGSEKRKGRGGRYGHFGYGNIMAQGKKSKKYHGLFNITNDTLTGCSNVACGLYKTNETGVIACREVSPWPFLADSSPMNGTVCADLDMHLDTDVCGPCAGDVIPEPCTECACNITKGPLEGEPGVLVWQEKRNKNKTKCVTSEQSITKQLEFEYNKYSYFCAVAPCPVFGDSSDD
mmetsp:Transcript_50410/g.75344  ORF Transcript_50410/g.75344 Transcript_50410/m.75344 type:complete len:237 (-) Transcript_50410:123-833(-)|eukprot:CAMPEP_0194048352 /NCGR_PEP_ID=MMETSP0009_2-20130614/27025_1 /TAXON_ID=210454 /ORGANISM="Grammatophora oceanica, Strain CCMP 410" /LENGTH=236 /DNA_ID=CAMNT_0038694197 /DNA_START=106 /DNA_END=816 /DNA_ORIENTATION=+